jgi:hypothetical protein
LDWGLFCFEFSFGFRFGFDFGFGFGFNLLRFCNWFQYF